MKILLISDQSTKSDHSAVEGLFYSALNHQVECVVDIVYFSEHIMSPSIVLSHKIEVPKKAKHFKIVSYLDSVIDLKQYDCVIIRNYFSVLKQFLKIKKRFNFKIGFWESFPHSYRRYEEARRFKKSVLRKSIQWFLKYKNQKKLINLCDFYLPISKKLQEDFYPDIEVVSYPLSLGINQALIATEKREKINSEVVKFVYTGTIDQLRNFDIILRAFMGIKENYCLDIYSNSHNNYTQFLKKLTKNDSRIYWQQPLNREALFKVLSHYDIACGIFPDSKTYRSASPTKTIEYYALGLPSILNHIPEYDLLFDDQSAFFCDFNCESIKKTIETIIQTPKEQLVEMGNRGQDVILKERSYNIMAERLICFLNTIS